MDKLSKTQRRQDKLCKSNISSDCDIVFSLIAAKKSLQVNERLVKEAHFDDVAGFVHKKAVPANASS